MLKAAQAYLSTQVNTTSQADILLMLYEGGIKYLRQAKVKIKEKDYAQKGILISKAMDVIAELDGSLNAERGGELAGNLHKLYFYCTTRLLKANLELNTALVDEVIGIMESLRGAFKQISGATGEPPLPMAMAAPPAGVQPPAPTGMGVAPYASGQSKAQPQAQPQAPSKAATYTAPPKAAPINPEPPQDATPPNAQQEAQPEAQPEAPAPKAPEPGGPRKLDPRLAARLKAYRQAQS